MRDDLGLGATVETIRPDLESTDWEPEALKNRRWGVSGTVVGRSDAHGLCFIVEHEDGTTAWYERRELKRYSPGIDYSPAERQEMLVKMQRLSDNYYGAACAAGCHAFIEFAGLMNEFIKVCAEAHAKGQDFPFSNTHSGSVLPFKPYNLAYLGEKLGCIYGPALLADEASRREFVQALFDGEFVLVRRTPQNCTECGMRLDWGDPKRTCYCGAQFPTPGPRV
jgi:hypothetical protein